MMAVDQQTNAPPTGNGQATQDGSRMLRLPLPRMPIEMPTGTPGRVLWWGGLAALATFEVVEWPVAVLVGVGSWVAERYAKDDITHDSVSAVHHQQAEKHMSSQA